MPRTPLIALAITITSLTTNTPAQQNQVEITVEDGYRYIRANGIPDHPTGQFPSRNNPNAVAPQDYAFRVPANPKTNSLTPGPSPGLLRRRFLEALR